MKNQKIKSASFNNRKKVLQVNYVSGKSAQVHYRQLGLKKNLAEVWVDKETGGYSLGLRFEDQTEDYMPYDQPLALVKDPEYMLQNHIELVVAHIKAAISRKKISKRFLAEQLHTSDNQIQRLLNPKILNKNLEQLYRIATLLGLEFEWHIKKAI
ncbi:MAG: hypothetical protein C5B49_01445 [Bdellovibrio sp.]|nr:MAG: hypothetical protein C5B49_01445 [Bdellovibrio sp.]